MDISIIGGNFGIKVLLPALLDFKEINIISATISSGETAKNQLSFGGVTIPIINLEKALNLDNVDAVFLAVPPLSQTDLAFRLIDKNVHIFLEKPLCHDIQYARKLVIAARNRKYITAINYTFFGLTQIYQLRALVNPYSRLDYKFVWNCRSKAFENGIDGWRFDSTKGGGALNNLASHFIALVDMLFGEISEIKAILNDSVNDNNLNFNESDGDIRIAHKKGAIGSFIFNSNFKGKSEITLIINVNNMVIKLQNLEKDYFRGFRLYLNDTEVIATDIIEDNNVDSRIKPLKRLVSNFIYDIKNNSQPELNLNLGLRVSEVINTCRLSSKAGGVWSKI